MWLRRCAVVSPQTQLYHLTKRHAKTSRFKTFKEFLTRTKPKDEYASPPDSEIAPDSGLALEQKGLFYWHGDAATGQVRDPLLAIRYFRQAKDKGMLTSKLYLVMIELTSAAGKHWIEQENAADPDPRRTLRILANGGHVIAQVVLGCAFLKGELGYPKDLNLSGTYLSLASGGGSPAAMYYMYLLYSQTGNATLALQALQTGSERGDPSSLYTLGNLYKVGTPLLERDYVMAFDLYKKSAEKGHSLGAFAAGIALIEGSGCVKDIKTGLEYVHHSSECGNSAATLYLARAYASGSLGIRDLPSAQVFYQILIHDPTTPTETVAIGEEELRNLPPSTWWNYFAGKFF